MSEIPRIEPAAKDVLVPGERVLTVHAVKVILEKEEKQEDPDRWQRLINRLLLAAATGLVTLWFYIHLKTWVAEKALLTTVTAFTVWQLVFSRVLDAAKDDLGPLGKKLMARQSTMYNLLFGLAAAITLFFVTTSVYVRLGKTDASKISIDVVDPRGSRVMKPLALGFAGKVDGQPLMSLFRARDVNVVVSEPKGYEPVPLSVWGFNPGDLSFPEDFRKRTLVRIYVPFRFKDELPAPEDPVQATLNVRVGTAVYQVRRFTFRTGYAGVKDDAAARSLVGAAEPVFEKARRADLAGVEGLTSAEIEQYLSMWKKGYDVVPRWNLRDGHRLEATVVSDGETILKCKVRVVGGEITDCVLER